MFSARSFVALFAKLEVLEALLVHFHPSHARRERLHVHVVVKQCDCVAMPSNALRDSFSTNAPITVSSSKRAA